MAAYQHSLTNLLVSIRRLLQEATASFWTDAQLTQYINDGISFIAETTGCYRTIKTVSTVALIRTVALTGYKCIAVEYDNKALIKIVPIQVGHAKLDGVIPQYWFEYGSNIGIEPIPPAIYSLTLYVADIPPALVNGVDVPVIPYSLQGLIVYFAVSRALEQDKKQAAAMQFMGMLYNELDYLSKMSVPNVPDGSDDLRFK
jgi:hypothetical protein